MLKLAKAHGSGLMLPLWRVLALEKIVEFFLVQLYLHSQDLKFGGEESIARIGDYTTIRECVTVNRGTSASGETIVGGNCLLMAYSHVAHDCIIGNHCIIANSVAIAGHVTIGDYAIIGGLSAVHQFVKIGAHSMISGGTLIRKISHHM